MKIRIKGNQLEEIEGLTPEYPYTLHLADFPPTHIPWHWHEEVEFDYVCSGSLEVMTASKSYIFRENEAFFINTNILCTMKAASSQPPARIQSHLLHPVFLSGHFKSIFETKYLEPVLKNRRLELLEIRGTNSRQREILSKLKKAASLQETADMEFQTRNLFSEIWILLLEEIKAQEPALSPNRLINQERIQTMMAFIQQNYGRKLSLDEIAASAAIGSRECTRCFQSCIHKTPFEYLLEYRAEAAGYLLKNTSLRIVDIALQTGFSSEAYFGKIFKRLHGMSPGAYRKLYGER